VTDSAGVMIALIAALLALIPAGLKRACGYERAEILAAAAPQATPRTCGLDVKTGPKAAALNLF
jgi:hypothetical protein